MMFKYEKDNCFLKDLVLYLGRNMRQEKINYDIKYSKKSIVCYREGCPLEAGTFCFCFNLELTALGLQQG